MTTFSKDDIATLKGLEGQHGSAPAMLASSIGIGLDNIIDSLDKLKDNGLVEIDENELQELGKKWTFCSLTDKGYRLAIILKRIDIF